MRQWEIGQAQSIGARREQQDRGEAFVLDDARTCLLVVADGMGGRAGGGEAAAAVITCARVMMQQHADARLIDGPALMRDIALSAHETIRAMTDDPDSGPRATITAFFADGNEGHWVSVGDSRLYRFRGHELVERTKDQSLVQLLVDMGEIDEPCPLGMTPSASTAVMLAISDAIALALMEAKGVTLEEYGLRHHGGYLGRAARADNVPHDD